MPAFNVFTLLIILLPAGFLPLTAHAMTIRFFYCMIITTDDALASHPHKKPKITAEIFLKQRPFKPDRKGDLT